MIAFRCTCGVKNAWSGNADTLFGCRSCRRLWIRDGDTYRPANAWELDYYRAGRLGRLLMRAARGLAGWLERRRIRRALEERRRCAAQSRS